MDRLINQSQKVNDHTSERIVRNNYDDLGQLKSKLTGNGTRKGYTDITSSIIITDDVINKTTGTGWNEGLATLGGFQQDGYVEYEIPQTHRAIMVGLSNDNTSASYNTIDYAIYTATGGNLLIYESGINRGQMTTYGSGDILRVERIGSKIFYKKNGEVFYISQNVSTGTLIGDISIYHTSGKIKNFHIVDNSKGLQNVDYTYNVRGWLKTINEDNKDDNDLFNFTLRYNDPTSGTPLYNGNISQTSWNTANTDTSIKTYTYSYDALNRIKSGIFESTNVSQNGRYDLTDVSYDKNGNILTLQRQGHTNAAATIFGMMDNLSYTYNSGNKLTQVDDLSGSNEGFKNGTNLGSDYTYDNNGNVISNINKRITDIQYNHLNLPVEIEFNNGEKYINYTYDASGVKQRKVVQGTTTENAGH